MHKLSTAVQQAPSSERSEENLCIIQARQLTPDNRIQEFQLNKNLFFSLQPITRCCNFVFFGT